MRLWIHTLSDARPSVADPRISVIIPCYNLGLYLYEAVESVLTQTMAEIEVIIVDDGSTDRYTQIVCDRMAEHPRVQLLRQENRGLPAARNAGIRQARAAAICCLDSDDRLMPAFLERALGLLQSDLGIGFVSCFYREFDGRQGLIQYESCDLPEMLWTNRAMVASLFRRTAWEGAGGYCENMRGMHDWDLWIGMLEAGYHGRMIPEVLFEYRVRAGSMYSSSSKPENYAHLVGQIVERHAALYQQWQAQVVAGWAREFANLVAYADGQAQLVHAYQGQASKFAELQHRGSLVSGLMVEIENWQRIADERARWIAQVEEARDYHAQQARNWQAVAQQAQESLRVMQDQHAALVRERDSLLTEGTFARLRRQLGKRRMMRLYRRREP